MIRALVFDFDGLILDTESPRFASWRQLYADYGAELTLDYWRRHIGLAARDFDPVDHLEAQLGRPLDREEVRRRRREAYLAMVERQPLRPGVRAYLEGATARGLRLAVASGSGRDWVSEHLARRGLAPLFQAVLTADDVERAKPDPSLYLAAVEALGVAPHEAIAIEDSPVGLAAARRAGLYCVAVPNPLLADAEMPDAHLRVASLADLCLDRLLALAARRHSGGAA